MFIWYEGQPVSRLSQITKTLLYTNFSTKFVHTCHAYRHHWFAIFIPVSGLDLYWGSPEQWKAKPNCFFFLHTLFNWSGSDLKLCWCSSSWIAWLYVKVIFLSLRVMTFFYLLNQNLATLQCSRHSWRDFIQTWNDDRCCWMLHFVFV